MTTISRLHDAAVRAAAVALITLSLYGCDSTGAGAASTPPSDPADFALLQTVARVVQRNYVEPVPGDALTKDALKGMLTRLDPHSDYMDQDQYQQMNAVTRGQFGGIGIELTLEGKVPEVISPIDGTPAANAGIEPGDRIVKIDGLATAGMDVETVVKRLRGPAGSRVVLEIARSNQAAFRCHADPRHDPRRFGQIGSEGRPDRLCPDYDIYRKHRQRARRCDRQNEGAGAWPAKRLCA